MKPNNNKLSKVKLKYRLANYLVWVANNLVRSSVATSPGRYPLYRPVDQTLPGKNQCGAYSLEGLESLVKQDGPNGFGATATVKWLIGDEGWVNLADLKHEDGTPYTAQESADMISKSLTLEATRQEQEELNRYDDKQ
jgi:hypothetical protein